MNERQYIVTGKHLRKLKDKLEESYLKIEKEWLRDWLEAIEAQEGAVRICDLVDFKEHLLELETACHEAIRVIEAHTGGKE